MLFLCRLDNPQQSSRLTMSFEPEQAGRPLHVVAALILLRRTSRQVSHRIMVFLKQVFNRTDFYRTSRGHQGQVCKPYLQKQMSCLLHRGARRVGPALCYMVHSLCLLQPSRKEVTISATHGCLPDNVLDPVPDYQNSFRNVL